MSPWAGEWRLIAFLLIAILFLVAKVDDRDETITMLRKNIAAREATILEMTVCCSISQPSPPSVPVRTMNILLPQYHNPPCAIVYDSVSEKWAAKEDKPRQ